LLVLEFGRGSIAGYVTDDKFQKRQKDRYKDITPYPSKLVKLFFHHYYAKEHIFSENIKAFPMKF